MNKYQISIEINSSKIKAIISEYNFNNINLIGYSSVNIKSFKNDIIEDKKNFFENLFKAYKEVLKSADLEFTYNIPINIILNFKNNKVIKNKLQTKINQIIKKEDIEKLTIENDSIIKMKKDFILLKTINSKYFIDEKQQKESPINENAKNLEIEFLNILVNKTNLEIIKKTFEELKLNINSINIDSSLLSFSFNENKYKKTFSIVYIKDNFIDLNLYEDNNLMDKYSILIGFDNIYKDLEILLNIDKKEAIKLTEKYLHLIFDENILSNNKFVKIVNINDNKFEDIEESLIINIIKARFYEFLLLINKIIIENSLYEYTDNGICLISSKEYLGEEFFIKNNIKNDEILQNISFEFKFDLMLKSNFKNLFLLDDNYLKYSSLLGGLIYNHKLENDISNLKIINSKDELLDMFSFEQKINFSEKIKESTLNISKKLFVTPYKSGVKWLSSMF